jgi:hypothetical protein
MLFAIKNFNNGEIDETTLASSEEEAWNLALGFEARDDQWAWQKQKAETNEHFCVEVEIAYKKNKSIDDYITMARKYLKDL